MATTPFAGAHPAAERMRRKERGGAGYSVLVAALFPACMVAELTRPAGETARAGTLSAALDRARASAAQAFSLPG